MIRRPPRSTRTDTLFPDRRSSDLLPAPALALETSFHTYDGFNETVDAFRLVSMIFADPRYETLVLIVAVAGIALGARSEEHTSELQSLMLNSYAVFCLNKKRKCRT